MGFLDRLLGREEQQPQQPQRRQAAPERSEDEIAVERYQYLLRTAPPETIEQVHVEAFSKLTPEQRDLLFSQLSESLSPSERPANNEPATLAKAATRAEMQEPGTLTRTFGGRGQGGPGQGGVGLGGIIGGSLLGSVAGMVIGSALVSAFMPPMDGGADAGGGDSGGGEGGDGGSGGDASGGSDGGDASGGDSGGGFGDFGGGDFGGGDFGGGF